MRAVERAVYHWRYISVSEDEMLRQLRVLLKRKGTLTTDIINAASGGMAFGWIGSTTAFGGHRA